MKKQSLQCMHNKKIICTFATALNCIDGRTHEPVIDFLRKNFRVTCVDLITEPGIDKILSENRIGQTVSSIKKRAQISVDKHQSKIIAVVGHYDCAGNPGTAKNHFSQVKKAVVNVHAWGWGITVIGLWVNKNFQAKQIMIKK